MADGRAVAQALLKGRWAVRLTRGGWMHDLAQYTIWWAMRSHIYTPSSMISARRGRSQVWQSTLAHQDPPRRDSCARLRRRLRNDTPALFIGKRRSASYPCYSWNPLHLLVRRVPIESSSAVCARTQLSRTPTQLAAPHTPKCHSLFGHRPRPAHTPKCSASAPSMQHLLRYPIALPRHQHTGSGRRRAVWMHACFGCMRARMEHNQAVHPLEHEENNNLNTTVPHLHITRCATVIVGGLSPP